SQGGMDRDFTTYHMDVVPRWWCLTKKAQSRIFLPPDSSVPAILKAVLEGLPQLKTKDCIADTLDPRDFCVQYREADFNFARRLMEEEGIYYYFAHEKGKHTMVLGNLGAPGSFPALPDASPIPYEGVRGGLRDEDRIYDWEKVQEVRSGRYTLR